MTNKMKRPTSNITQGSIKPSLSKAVEFYTNSNKQAHKCIQERDEYINSLEAQLDYYKKDKRFEAMADEILESKEKYAELLDEKQQMQDSYIKNQSSYEEELANLKSQLQQQALPIVPDYVAKAVEYYKNCKLSLNGALNEIFNEKTLSLTTSELQTWMISSENQNDFALAFITGEYQVKKPQQKRYEVKLLSGEPMYFNPIGNPKNIKDYRFSFGNYAGWKTKFTKSELSEIKDGMFLKRISGGTNLDDLGKDKSYYVWIDDCNYWINPLIDLVPVEDGE